MADAHAERGSAPMPRPGDAEPSFYVGYLRVPTSIRRLLAVAVPGMLVLLALVAAVISATQRDPGGGVWESGIARTFAGVIVAEPYPHLRVLSDGRVESLLLVEVGKFGGGQRVAALDGKVARISGWLLERDGRRMLEMEPAAATGSVREDASALSPADAARLRDATIVRGAAVALEGEVVDSKCYLGAMKPGAGKTHKECATLCIAGGIPPMLVTRDAAGEKRYLLLADMEGRALDDRLLPFVADPIAIEGVLEHRDDLAILRVDVTGIHRQ